MNNILKSITTFFHRRKTCVKAPSDESPLTAFIDSGQLASPNSLLRLGTKYGGWIIPVESGLNEDSLCYLAGAGEDISFDCALTQRFGCKNRIIDPTPRAIEHFQKLEQAVRVGQRFPVNNSTTEFYDINATQLERLSFLPVGLSDKDIELRFFLPKNPDHVSCSTVNLQKTETYFIAQCYRLKTIMAQQGDTVIDLLKIDIEGAEYAVIRDLIASSLLPRLLLIEFDETHTPQDTDANERIRTHIHLLLNAGMRCIAVEGNNMTLIHHTRN
ncbi:FkbM family methyltransferase [Azospirillaceae bacterium]